MAIAASIAKNRTIISVSYQKNRFHLLLLTCLSFPFPLSLSSVFALGKQLHVNSNALGQAGGEAFAEALKTNSTLGSIVIGSEDKPATIPLKELRENSVDALDFKGKELLVEGGIVLASALKGNSSVTKVGQHVFYVFILFYFW